MTRKRWIYRDGVAIPADEFTATQSGQSAPAILGDYAPFISPIDGTVVEGRRQFREHCLKHDVVPTADLAGLPMRQAVEEYRPSAEYREATKRAIAEAMSRHRKT